jgi:hypothetical protein
MNKDKMLNIVFGIILFCSGLFIIRVKEFSWRGGYVDFSSPFLYFPIGLFLIIAGIYFVLSTVKSKDKK